MAKKTSKKKAAATPKKVAGKKASAKKSASKKSAKKKAAATPGGAKKAAKKKVVKKKVSKNKAATGGVADTPTVKPSSPRSKRPSTNGSQAGGRPGKAAAERGLEADARPSGQRPRITPAPPASRAEATPSDEPLSDDQLRKVKTGLKKKDLNTFRDLLLEQRAEIVGDVQGFEASRGKNAGDLSHMPLHMADVGSDNFEQEFTLGLMESERRTLIEIDEALQRISDGTYGVCIESGVPIARPRLEAKPWAKYTIEVAREHERRGGR